MFSKPQTVEAGEKKAIDSKEKCKELAVELIGKIDSYIYSDQRRIFNWIMIIKYLQTADPVKMPSEDFKLYEVEKNYFEARAKFETGGNPENYKNLDSLMDKFATAPSVELDTASKSLELCNSIRAIFEEIEKSGQTSEDNLKKLKDLKRGVFYKRVPQLKELLNILQPEAKITETLKPSSM